MDAVNETAGGGVGPPENADGQLGELAERREGNETIRIITHAAEQVKPYSYRAEALRELAAFTAISRMETPAPVANSERSHE